MVRRSPFRNPQMSSEPAALQPRAALCNFALVVYMVTTPAGLQKGDSGPGWLLPGSHFVVGWISGVWLLSNVSNLEAVAK